MFSRVFLSDFLSRISIVNCLRCFWYCLFVSLWNCLKSHLKALKRSTLEEKKGKGHKELAFSFFLLQYLIFCFLELFFFIAVFLSIHISPKKQSCLFVFLDRSAELTCFFFFFMLQVISIFVVVVVYCARYRILPFFFCFCCFDGGSPQSLNARIPQVSTRIYRYAILAAFFFFVVVVSLLMLLGTRRYSTHSNCFPFNM